MPANRLISALSALIFIVCLFAYVASFFGPPVDRLLPWSILLGAGILVSFSVIYFLELPDTKWGLLTWKQLHRNVPDWVSRFEVALQVLWAAHFLWMIKNFGAGVPAIMGGEYVLESRGHILGVLAENEYLALMCLELRCIAFAFIVIYFGLTMYWWFYRKHAEAA